MYQLWTPAAELSPYIEHYWRVCATAEAPLDLSVDVFVDLRADLIFNFGDPYTRSILRGESQRIARSNLDAQRLAPIRIEQRGAVHVVGVRFRVAGLAPFVRVSLDAFNDRTPAIDAVFGEDALALESALRDGDDAGRRAALDQFFLRRMRVDERVRTVLELCEEIQATHGAEKIETLVERLATTQRSVDRLFRRHVGFSPKTVARVARFQRALTRLKGEPERALSTIAAECGYYDQPHFVRDFKRFAGAVPTRQAGYFPEAAPQDFSPNLVQFVQTVQDGATGAGEPRRS